MTIVLILILALGAWSFIKFRKRYKMDKMLCEMLGYKFNEFKTPETQMEFACGLMLCQRYADALTLLQDMEQRGLERQFDFLRTNIAFCKKPLPWSSKIKNYNGSWWHNFLLVRFGGTRKVAISQESYLEANAMLRMMDRMSRN